SGNVEKEKRRRVNITEKDRRAVFGAVYAPVACGSLKSSWRKCFGMYYVGVMSEFCRKKVPLNLILLFPNSEVNRISQEFRSCIQRHQFSHFSSIRWRPGFSITSR